MKSSRAPKIVPIASSCTPRFIGYFLEQRIPPLSSTTPTKIFVPPASNPITAISISPRFFLFKLYHAVWKSVKHNAAILSNKTGDLFLNKLKHKSMILFGRLVLSLYTNRRPLITALLTNLRKGSLQILKIWYPYVLEAFRRFPAAGE